jgi:hypothetical protein
MINRGETWLCVNEDGQYVVFNVYGKYFLDYVEDNDGVYRFLLCWLDDNNVLNIHDSGVYVHERYFATNLQGMDPGDKVRLK